MRRSAAHDEVVGTERSREERLEKWYNRYGMDGKVTALLQDYFEAQPSVLLAFVYGSAARNMLTEESDFDIAVYLKDGAEEEDRIWRDVSRLLTREVDLVNLAFAPATLVSNVIKTGIPIVIKDRNLYWKFYLEDSMEAEDFAEFARSYQAIYERSRSLIPEDKTRLLERINFLKQELAEIDRFQSLSFEEYRNNNTARREIERWTENVINALIDIAKIILSSEKKSMPKTYEEALREFAHLAGLPKEKAESFAMMARLRNVLAHEYLDILYERIRAFLNGFPHYYEKIQAFLKKYSS